MKMYRGRKSSPGSLAPTRAPAVSRTAPGRPPGRRPHLRRCHRADDAAMSNPTAGPTDWYVDAYHRAGGRVGVVGGPSVERCPRPLFSPRVSFRHTGAGEGPLAGSVRTGRSLLVPRNVQPISDAPTLGLPLSPLQRSGPDTRFESSLPSHLPSHFARAQSEYAARFGSPC
jgi:hypothetical protein